MELSVALPLFRACWAGGGSRECGRHRVSGRCDTVGMNPMGVARVMSGGAERLFGEVAIQRFHDLLNDGRPNLPLCLAKAEA